MEAIFMYAPRHMDGYFLTVRCEPTDSIRAAVRFKTEDELHGFLWGMYGPVDPANYTYEQVKITYELEERTNGTNSEGAA